MADLPARRGDRRRACGRSPRPTSGGPSADWSGTASSSRPRSQWPRRPGGPAPTRRPTRREMTKVLGAARPHRRPMAGLRDGRRQAAGLPADDRYAGSADRRLPQGQAAGGPAAAGDRRRHASATAKPSSNIATPCTSTSAAFDVAEAEAIRRRRSDFSAEGQQRLERAQNLLRLAVDGAATPQERQNAYARAQKELDGLIVLPAATRASIERKIAGEIEA